MKIEIRRVEPGDYKAVQQLHAQPSVLRGTLQVPFPSEEMWKERLAKLGADDYGLVAVVEGKIVGMASLAPSGRSARRKHAVWIGLIVDEKWQSKGIGTALLKAVIDLADKWLDLSRLELTVFVDNEAAIKLYKKLGFVVEGTFRKFAFRDGEYVDAYSMARVR